MANTTKDIPIVATAFTDYEAAKLVWLPTIGDPKLRITGTGDMLNPIKRAAGTAALRVECTVLKLLVRSVFQ